MTHDCRLGWHHAAQLIADRMPASFNPNAPRLIRVPLPQNARALDVDPATASKPAAAPAAALGEWIEWGGGECPVAEFTHIDIKFRCESKALGVRMPQDLRWNYGADYAAEFDIVAYRLLPKEPA